ncbi:MAG: hypothetical protein A2176_08560 [Spirochaetes bacterium RBG_13_51_14]|nr:MAG: hypothetical protein A2176_08560 [Spirochaetes bacterium RBG_13_51_14]
MNRKIKNSSIIYLLFSIACAVFFASCDTSDFPEDIQVIDTLSNLSILFLKGKDPEIIEPDEMNSGPACGCGHKDSQGSGMTNAMVADDGRAVNERIDGTASSMDSQKPSIARRTIPEGKSYKKTRS